MHSCDRAAIADMHEPPSKLGEGRSYAGVRCSHASQHVSNIANEPFTPDTSKLRHPAFQVVGLRLHHGLQAAIDEVTAERIHGVAGRDC